MAWVYILKTSSGLFYIGSTTDIDERIRHHNGGHTPSTSKMGSIELALAQEYSTLGEARIIERRLKNLKRRDYIEKIIKEGIIKMRV